MYLGVVLAGAALGQEAETLYVAGIVLDEQGQPQPDVRVWGTITPSNGGEKGAQIVMTDAQGRFRLDFQEAGAVTFNVNRPRDTEVGGNLSPNWPILEGERVELSLGHRIDDYRLVVRPIRVQYVHGTLIDEDGNALRAHLEVWDRDGYASMLEYVDPGQFLVKPYPSDDYKFPETFLLIFTERGYETRILQSGIDFEVGDDDVRVVMEKGPFEQEPSVWEQMTGRPFTKEEVARTIRSGDIRLREFQYRQLALPREDRPAPTAPPGPTKEEMERFEEIVALGKRGWWLDIRRLRKLRQEAFELTGAPVPKESYTHGERMAETLQLMFLLCGMEERAEQVNVGSAVVDEGYETGTITAGDVQSGETTYHMRRFGEDWFVVKIGQTAIA